jgi:hypothetical protein
MDRLENTPPEQSATPVHALLHCDRCGAEIVAGDHAELGDAVEGVRLARHCDDCRCKIAVYDRDRLRRHVFREIRILAKAPAAVRNAILPTLVGQVRDAGLAIDEKLLRRVGCQYWKDLLLARPTVQFDKLVHLLATHARDPAEKQFDPRVSLAYVRIHSALDEWVAAGHLQAFKDQGGNPRLKNPHAAVELLLADPKTADLLPPSLRAAIKEQQAGAGQPPQPAPRARLTGRSKQSAHATRKTHEDCLKDYFETEGGKRRPSQNRAFKFTQERLGERAYRPSCRDAYKALRPDLKKRGPRNPTSPPGK